MVVLYAQFTIVQLLEDIVTGTSQLKVAILA